MPRGDVPPPASKLAARRRASPHLDRERRLHVCANIRAADGAHFERQAAWVVESHLELRRVLPAEHGGGHGRDREDLAAARVAEHKDPRLLRARDGRVTEE